MPAVPYDAKGLLIAAVRDGNPVMYIDDRRLYDESGEVPEEMYEVPIGKAVLRRIGQDVTLVATSAMVSESLKAAETLHIEEAAHRDEHGVTGKSDDRGEERAPEAADRRIEVTKRSGIALDETPCAEKRGDDFARLDHR